MEVGYRSTYGGDVWKVNGTSVYVVLVGGPCEIAIVYSCLVVWVNVTLYS